MKRENKFRALTKSEVWAYGMPCKSNYGIEMVTELYHVDGAEWNEYGEDVRPETVGQFTGLHDKNGKEIYEGDILQSHYGDGPIGEVMWNDEYACFDYRDENLGCYAKDMLQIIGNIYENPKLIKQ